MSTTPNQKDLLAKKTDLEGILKPDANDILHLPDITITLAENGQFYLAGISKKLLTLIGNTSGNAVTLDGDAGLTFTTSGGSSTITGITSSSGNSATLAASQSMVSAKQDALTAGTNITISNNTISATDTNTLSDLTDTAISSLADGQVLKYNATSGKWVNGTGGGGAEVILGTTAPTAAQGSNGNLYIQYDDTNNNTVTHEYVKISGAWEEIAIGGGGGSTTTVTVTPKVLTGTNIADIIVGNGNTTDIYDYAYFDGSGYYETPFKVDTDYEYEITFEANYDTTMAVIGTYAGANYFHLTIYNNDWYVGTNSGEVVPSAYTTGKHTFKTDSSHTYLDDTQFTSYTPAVVNNYITIGARENTYLYKGKFYEFKIKSISTGNVLYDLVPGMRGATKGLYDLVSDTFVECSFISNMGTKTGTSGGVTTQLYAPSIEANPSGTATDSLSSIEINGTIYNIESGGGSSSGGLRSTTLLSTPITATGTYTLADSYTNYDFIGFRAGNGSNETDILLYPVKEITDAMNDSLIITNPVTNSWFNFTISGSSLVITGKTVDTIYSVIGYKVGGGTGADEMTLAEYNALTTEQKNDGTIRFIPESNIGSSTAINMSYITKFKEADMDDIATSSSETTITWDGGVYIGNTYYYTTPIDVTDYNNIIFDLTTGSCYGGGSSAQQTRWNIQVGLMSVAPTAVLVIDATDSSWTVCKDFANSNTVYSGQELDVSELTGSYYLVINAHGWNATLENFILATEGGNPSQIKYMDKTYANNSGGGTTVVANPQDPATDTLSTIEIDGTIYNIEGSGGGSVTTTEEIYKNTTGTIPDTINLTKPINDFDIILITGFRSNTPTWKMSTFYVSSTINSGDVIELNDDAYYAWYTVTDFSTLTKNAVEYDVIDTIYGLKFGSGGGSGGSGGFITYSTTATLTQYGWWTVEDKDGNTLNPDDYIIIDISVSTDNSSSWNGAYDVLWYHETGNNNYYAATFVDINDGRFPRSSGSFPVTVTYAPKGGGGGTGLPNNYTVTADSLKINNEAPSTGVAWTIEDDTDYFDSAAGITVSTRVYQKTNAVPALGGVYMVYASGNTWTTVMFTSTDATAVAYSGNAEPLGSFTYLGHTWYFSGTEYALSGDHSSEVSGARYIGDFSQYDYSTKECCIEAAKYLIDHAGVSFEENNFTTISRPSTGYIIAGGGSAPDFSDATFKVTKQGNIYSKGNLLEDIFQKKSQELTSSQYENLTFAEKTNGTIYFINDPVSENQLISRVSAADSHITSSGHSGWGGADWHAFDGITGSLGGIDNAWCALENDATPWIQYHFDTPYYFTKLEMKVYCHYGSDGKTVSMNILASNDGTNWDNISMSGTAVSVNFPYQTLSTVEFDLNNGGNKYEYIRIQGTEPFEVAYSYGCDFDEIYVYGTDQGSPVKKIYYMNSLYAKSNDSSIERKYLGQLINRVVTDDSHIIKSSENSKYPAWGAFNGVSPTHFGGGTDPEQNTCWLSTVNEATPYLGYHFDTPYYFTKIDIKCFSNYSTDWVHNIQVLGSKDGNNYENILAEGSTYELTAPYLTNTTTSINLNETDTYSYIKVVFSSPVSIAYQPSCFVDEIYVYGGEIVENKKDLHTYSTTEQAIGTWVDGKTLYEKTYHYSGTISGITYIDQSLTTSNVDYFTYSNMSYIINNSYRGSGFQLEMGVTANGIFLYDNNAPSASYSDIYATIRYTKITQGQN